MNLTVSLPEITLNNSFIVYCFSYFITATFLSYIFKQSNLFFKFFIFFMGIGYIQFLWNIHSIEATLSALAGFIFIYRESISEFFSSITSTVENLFYNTKSLFVGIFSTILGCFYFIFRIFSFIFNLFRPIFKRATDHRADDNQGKKSGSWWKKAQDQSSREEAINKAKEDLKRAREEAKKREEQEESKKSSNHTENSDDRSFEEILGLSNPFTKSDLNKAYKIAVSRYHPDKYVHMSELFQQEARQEFVKIQRAYNYLLGRISDD